MGLQEQVDQVAALLAGWPDVPEDDPAILAGLSDGVARLARFGDPPDLAVPDDLFVTAQALAEASAGVPGVWDDTVSGLTDGSRAMAAALQTVEAVLQATVGAVTAKAATAADTLDSTVEEVVTALAALTEVWEAYGGGLEGQVRPAEAAAESALERLAEALTPAMQAALDATMTQLASQEADARGVLDRATAALERDLLALEAAARERLQQGLQEVQARAQGAIEARTIAVVERELAQATSSILQGQTVQAALSTGPWLMAIRGAKTAMDMLP